MTTSKAFFILFLIFSLFACSMPKMLNRHGEAKKNISEAIDKSLFYKDGQLVHFLKCKGPSWSTCLEYAGEICRNKGFEVLEKNTVTTSSLFSSDKIQNEMYISCKIIDGQDKK